MSEVRAVRAGETPLPPVRPEFVHEVTDAGHVGEIQRPLSVWERVTNIASVRRMFLLVLIALIWQAYAVPLNNPLMFPTFSATAMAFWDALVRGDLPARIWVSISVLLE